MGASSSAFSDRSRLRMTLLMKLICVPYALCGKTTSQPDMLYFLLAGRTFTSPAAASAFPLELVASILRV